MIFLHNIITHMVIKAGKNVYTYSFSTNENELCFIAINCQTNFVSEKLHVSNSKFKLVVFEF